MTKRQVLIFEDERSIAETLKYALETDGFGATHVTTAQAGLDLLAQRSFDLILLDIGLPDINGIEVCKRIRNTSSVPIFFLTARSSELDKILGLEIGADDYIAKPFSPREVTARVKALFRRLESITTASDLTTRGPFTIDKSKFQITLSGRPLSLTRYEFGLLETLLKAPGRVYSRTQLMEMIWDEPDMSLDRTIDTHIKALRTKLRDIDPREFINTHRGLGYSFTENI